MGTGHPPIEITAATLAGGSQNQDRYAYGDGWAFVLDGASSFAKTQPKHDGGWYADYLKQALSAGLIETPERKTPEMVEDAIQAVAEAHGGDADSCPTSTIALARWDNEAVEVYVLGDSTAVLISASGEEVLSDVRLAEIAQPTRQAYRSRLGAGHGFDDSHRELLQELQAEQAAARNRANGYWIAGADPQAAHHGLTNRRPLSTVRKIVIATDGATAGLRYGVAESWTSFAASNVRETLERAQLAEAEDETAQLWPRSKVHDDKTAIVIVIGGALP